MTLKLKSEIIIAIDQALQAKVKVFSACEAIQLCPRKLLRWRKITHEDKRIGGYRATGQKFSSSEKDDIVAALNLPEIKDLPIKVAHASLMDKGIYLGSPSTFVRVAAERQVRKAKPIKANRPKRPELKANGHGQIWCWDITWLKSPHMGKYFYLYMVIDMFSRKVVAWEVFAKEDGALARILISQAMEIEVIQEGQLTVHADNGKPMRSNCLRTFFEQLSVTPSHGRPYTSNDNAFAESLFATLKGRISFPEYFGSLQSARLFCMEFFTWYNGFHLHSKLDYVTPMQVHNGLHTGIYAERNRLLEKNRIAYPSRYGSRKKYFGIAPIVELKHRVSMTTTIL